MLGRSSGSYGHFTVVRMRLHEKKMEGRCSIIMVTFTSLKIVSTRISYTYIDTWKQYYILFILCKFPN